MDSKQNLIRLSKSIFDEREAKEVTRILLEDGYTGMGKEVQKFEQELQEFLHTDKEIGCVNSGTAALHLAVDAVTKPGDEVLVQALTFVACFQAISGTGAVPVACEIDPSTFTIDLQDAEKRITAKTKAIMPVHYASDPANLDEIYEFAKKHNLRVIEDAAHAFGTIYDEKLIGSFGDIICFSFDGIKNITCGEGGAVVTGDPVVAQYIRDARLLGIQKDTEKRYEGRRSWEFDVVHQGYRYHMSNILAAIGRVQLQKFPMFKKVRQDLSKRYLELLKDIKGIELFIKDYDKIVPHIFSIKVLDGKRDGLKEHLMTYNIESGIHYYPSHVLSFYKKEGVELPKTNKAYAQLLTLPLHPDLTQDNQTLIVEKIKEYLNK